MARQHHGVDYVEFSAPDLAAVEAFYSAAFGWRFTARSDSCVAFSGPGLGGCFDHGPARPGGALVTLYSRDLEATLDSVQRAGGHICKGLFAFPGGRRFQFTDPAGYELAVWSDAPPLQDEVQRAQHHAEEERKHAGAKGSAGARSSRPRRVRSRFTARQTAAKFRVVCSPTTKKYRACISALVSDTDSVLVVCAENSEGDVAAAVAAAGGREERVAVSHGSCWDAVSLIELEREAAAGGFNVVCVDLSMCGHTLVADGHALLKMLQSLFESTLHTVLVKSKALERHARAWHNSHSLMCAGLPRHHICQDVQIICAEGVTDYRATIPRVLAAGDRVLEIGCADGVTTQILAAHLKRQEQKSGGGASVIGIDVGPVVVEKARRVQAARMERATAEGSVEEQAICRFEVADAWDVAGLLKLAGGFDVIYIDVGGISGTEGVLEGLALVRLLAGAFGGCQADGAEDNGSTACACGVDEGGGCGSGGEGGGQRPRVRCIVVKSRCLRLHSSIMRSADEFVFDNERGRACTCRTFVERNACALAR